jgi:lactoylglutathione lyase
MIAIEHIALWVDDIDSICNFYARYFGAAIGNQYVNSTKGFTSRFLSFASGARIEVMHTTQLTPARLDAGAQRMGLTHFAVQLESPHAVDNMVNAMRVAGVTVIDGPRHTGDGYYEAVVLDPEGNRVELVG